MSKKDGSQLSDEFQKEIKESRKNNSNIFSVITAVIAIVLVFSTLGIATYQIAFKSQSQNIVSSSDKIKSRPEEKTEVVATDSSQTPKTEEVKTEEPKTESPKDEAATTPSTKEYTVADGDVLGAIASKFNTTVTKIMELNNITDENSLQIGQTLKVPNN
jgi:LysM repeat protein